jgi:hypothetical protein
LNKLLSLKTAENANASFYDAFESLSIEEMENVWSHDENVICIHPGWEALLGWFAIRESWFQIFQNTDKISIQENTLRSKKYGNLAIIVCLEHIDIIINSENHKSGVLATNVYENHRSRWLLTHHHGSAISNYLIPNSEIFNSE